MRVFFCIYFCGEELLISSEPLLVFSKPDGQGQIRCCRLCFVRKNNNPKWRMSDLSKSTVYIISKTFFWFKKKNSGHFNRKHILGESQPEFMEYILVVLFQAKTSLLGNGPVNSASVVFFFPATVAGPPYFLGRKWCIDFFFLSPPCSPPPPKLSCFPSWSPGFPAEFAAEQILPFPCLLQPAVKL